MSTPRRVLLAGDTHGDMEQARYLFMVADLESCDAIVQVGDFGYWPHMAPYDERVNKLAVDAGIDFYWLDGNHENFDALEEAVNTEAPKPQQMRERLWYLPRGCTWTWQGCRLMALGGAYSIDKEARVEGRSWWRQELITAAQVETAMSRGHVDVLLTHDAPEGVCPIVSGGYKGDEISRGNRLAVTAVVEATRPKLLVHGHYHYRYSSQYTQNTPQVEGLGRDGMLRDSWLVIEPEAWAS
jgi:predicted phosphodiesterase